MQLNPRKLGRVAQGLGVITAGLLGAGGALAEPNSDPTPPPPQSAEASSDVANDQGLTRIDAAVLYYKEVNNRVTAIEPEIAGTLYRGDEIISAKILSDTTSGATPTGAAPWKALQNFYVFQTPAHQLPTYPHYTDQRESLTLGYSNLLSPDTRISLGAYASTELDFAAFSFNAGIAQDLNHKNTTLSLAYSREYDISFPTTGTPTPMRPSYLPTNPASQHRLVDSLVAGVTQVMTRRWLTQLSYEIGYSHGYLTDPYRSISVVDASSGAPVGYLAEGRPRHRLRQSLYWSNKVAVGSTVFTGSARIYHDDWGITSGTVEVSERIPVTRWLNVEPEARYYHQTAASFFQYYLPGNQPLPTYASADYRLSEFTALTGGVRLGVRTPMRGEVYLLVDEYKQFGRNRLPNAPGDLATENFFAGAQGTRAILGYTFAF